MSKIDKAAVKKELTKIVKYQISGLAVIATDWGLYFMLNSLLGGFSNNLSFRYSAQFISYSCGAIVSYAINRKWTFGTDSKFFSRKMFQFLLLNLGSLVASEGVLALASQLFLLQGSIVKEVAVKIVVDVFPAVLNYIGIRFWIFRGKEVRAEHQEKPLKNLAKKVS